MAIHSGLSPLHKRIVASLNPACTDHLKQDPLTVRIADDDGIGSVVEHRQHLVENYRGELGCQANDKP